MLQNLILKHALFVANMLWILDDVNSSLYALEKKVDVCSEYLLKMPCIYALNATCYEFCFYTVMSSPHMESYA